MGDADAALLQSSEQVREMRSIPHDKSEDSAYLISSASSPFRRRDTLPLFEEMIVIDDHFGAKVLVFPKVIKAGGTINPDEMIQEPLALCKRIFVRERNFWRSQSSIDSCFEALHHGPVSALLYHEVVRAKILEVLHGLGLQVRSFESIDGDEVFMAIWLDPKGEVVRNLAHRYQYRMPFTPASYECMEPCGNYKGGEPMKNFQGRAVVAYTEYQDELGDVLEPFREVDMIRLLELCLDEWLNFSEMVQQGILLHVFTAANYDHFKELHREWGTLTKTCWLPANTHTDRIRDYFGEEVAFFFQWFAFYVRALVPLALVALACSLGEHTILKESLLHRRYLHIIYTFVLIGWASFYNAAFKHRTARERQRWGMKDHEEFLLERPSFDPKLEGTCWLRFRVLVVKLVPVLYCVIFVFVVRQHDEIKKIHRETGIRWLRKDRYISNAVLIKVFSLLWSRIAPHLTDLQNHRTQRRWNNALITILGSVKLFVTLFPFINEAFLKSFSVEYCGETLKEAALQIYGHSRTWPTGVSRIEDPSESDLIWLKGYYTNTTSGRVCISGCFPAQCHERQEDYHCVTSCIIGLENSLQSVYILHVACTVAHVLIPICLTRLAIEREILKEKAEGKHFSLLQLQAKCCAYAAYEYMSWGGSQVEDFLELAIGYALLTCFGIVFPAVSIFALLSHIVEYRLLAYRMTNITCRPFPLSSEGIGHWQNVFEAISFLAMATNVGLAVTQMYPMRFWQPGHKFAAFVFLEHSLLLLYICVTYVLPAEPMDVQRVEDFNKIFKLKLLKSKPLRVPASETCDLSEVDIGVESRARDPDYL